MVRKLAAVFALSVISTTIFAQVGNIHIVGSQLVSVPLNTSLAEQKWVTFEKISLSPQAKSFLLQHSKDSAGDVALGKPSKVSIGMNNVPVLDQGIHGTCATFATTGAYDAAYGQGDYVSQLCNLELGSYLEEHDSSYYSGWDGTWDMYVAAQLTKYGAIPVSYQMSDGCAGVKVYPAYNSSIGNPMSVSDFTQHSVNIAQKVSYSILLSPSQALSAETNNANLIKQIKTSLRQNHRVVFGVLVDVNRGGVGAFGTNVVQGDTWILTPQIRKDAENGSINAGHAMIITGYDDTRVVTGPNNLKQKGIFILRNSWGTSAGNGGEYYMTYAYFKLLVMEAVQINS